MRTFSTVLMLLLLATAASADSFSTLGYREDTVIQGAIGDDCVGAPVYNHDMSFENAGCWHLQGSVPPYYGAFAEGYDLGAVNVECGLIYLTQIGYYYGQPMDAYVWDGGVHAAPEGVLCVVPGILDLQIGYWPTCTLTEVEFDCCVDGDFAVGSWADFSPDICGWYWCADENGPGGYPWTCIAPGIGWPTGWHPVNVVFPDFVSMGIGVTVTDEPSPPESPTWGAIKALFRPEGW